MLPFREGNHTCPQRHKYSEMVGTHHPVGARGIVARRFWAVKGGETTPRYDWLNPLIFHTDLAKGLSVEKIGKVYQPRL